MTLASPKYCFDSSTWIFIGQCLPLDCKLFKGAWEWLEKLAADGYLVTPDVVQSEVLAKNKELCDWMSKNGVVVVSDDALKKRANEIMAAFPVLVSQKARLAGNLGDPYVIALAEREKAVVVHEEKERSNLRLTGKGTTSIAQVCTRLGLLERQWVSVVSEQHELAKPRSRKKA